MAGIPSLDDIVPASGGGLSLDDIVPPGEGRRPTRYDNPEVADIRALPEITGTSMQRLTAKLETTRANRAAGKIADRATATAQQVADQTAAEDAKKPGFFGNVGQALHAGTLDMIGGFDGIARSVVDNLNDSPVNRKIHEMGKRTLLDSIAEHYADAQKGATAAAKLAYGDDPQGFVTSNLKTGVRSVPNTLASLVVAAMGAPEAGAAFVAAPTGGQAYGQARDKGLTVGKATQFGLAQGIIEDLTERLPVIRYFKDTKAGSTLAKKVMNNFAHELVGEEAATALQDFNEWAYLNPGKPLGDYVAERPKAALATAIAVSVGSGLAVSIEHGAHKLATGQHVEVPAAPAYTPPTIAQLPDEAVLTPEDHASPIPNKVIASGRKAAGGVLAPDAIPDSQNAAAVIDHFVQKASAVESGNNPTATNPQSSATGAHQFVKGTWLSLIKSARPNIAAGKSDEEILALRNNPLISAQMAAVYARQNGDVLARNGHQVDEGSLYLSHFLGSGGANAVLSADPSTPVEQILKPGQINANKSILAGKTAGDVIGWAYGKMGKAPGATTGTATPQTTDQQIEGAQAFITRILGDENGGGGDVALEQADDSGDTGALSGDGSAVPAAEPVAAGQPLSAFQGIEQAPAGEPSPIAPVAAPTDTSGPLALPGGQAMAVERADAALPEADRTAPASATGAITQGPGVETPPAQTFADNGSIPQVSDNALRAMPEIGGYIRSLERAVATSKNQVGEQFSPEQVDALRDILARAQNVAAQPAAPAPILDDILPAVDARDKPRYTAPDRKAPRQRNGPVDALTFIADRGGLRDDEGHNLRKRGREMGQYAPGGGHIFRKNGMSIDQAGELLHEAGYFTGPRPSEADVLDMLHRSETERVYRPEDSAAVSERDTQARWPGEDEVRSEIARVADEYGEPLTPREVRHIMDLMASGDSAHEAFVRHFEMEAADILEEALQRTRDQAYDVPQAQEGDPGYDETFDPAPEAGQGDERSTPAEVAAQPREPSEPDSPQGEEPTGVEEPRRNNPETGLEDGQDEALTEHERAALEYAVRSEKHKQGGAGWAKDSPEGARVLEMLKSGRTSGNRDVSTLEGALRVHELSMKKADGNQSDSTPPVTQDESPSTIPALNTMIDEDPTIKRVWPTLTQTEQRAITLAAFRGEDAAKLRARVIEHMGTILPGGENSTLTDVEQPKRTMTQEQRSELEARQKQQMARRGGQEAVSDQSGGLFSAERDQADLLAPKAEPKPAAPAETAATTPAESADKNKIEDFGEKIIGARKDYATKLQEANGLDIATEPLSKTWPEPDYQKLIAGGADSYLVSTVRAMRETVPTKPQKSWKLKGWVESVREMRTIAEKMLANEDTGRDINKVWLSNPQMRGKFFMLENKIDLYEALGHENSLKGIDLSAGNYTMYKGEKFSPSKTIWTVSKAAKATAFGNMPRILADGDTKKDAIEAFKKRLAAGGLETQAKQVQFDIYSRTKAGAKTFFIGKKVGRDYADLKSFDTLDAARAYKRENYADLVKALESYKDIPAERKERNSPRIGENFRDGADVTPQQFGETFGFRGVQFGNYVEDGRRQADLNEAYDALMDMAAVLGVEPKALSLNGELGLAFGARGKGGKGAAAAHYEPGNIVINLTKASGAGALGHEWWHALDNYFSRAGADGKSYLTERSFQPSIEGVRPEMVAAFNGTMKAVTQTGILERSRGLDKRRTGKPYWSTGREMTARAFESYLINKLADQDGSNDYLANVVPESAYGIEGSYPYPTAGELPAIRDAFDNLFNAIETDTSGGKARLYSRTESNAEWDSVRGDLAAEVKRLKLGDKVTVKVIDRMLTDPDVAGNYDQRVISIAMDSPQSPSFTLNHEVIHAFRDLGLFRQVEWAALENAARADSDLMENVRSRYEGLDEESIAEEAVADMYARWRRDRQARGFVRTAFQRIADLLAAVRQLVTGSPRAADVMRSIEKGAVGEREASPSSGVMKFSLPAPGPTGTEPNRGVIENARQSARDLFANLNLPEHVDTWRRKLQDRMLPLLRAQQDIAAALGKAIPEDMDAYLSEELMEGKIGARLERLHGEIVTPLIDSMRAANVSLDELETYLYARHAPERNARISEINPTFEKGTGSGMTDQEAAAIMDAVNNGGKRDALEALAARVDEMLKFARNARVESGLLSKEEAEAWDANYSHYVPLRGTGEIDPEAGEGDRPRRGSGINVKGKESRAAFGRKSRAANILAYSLMQAEEAIIRAHTNEVAQSFHALAVANPDPEFWTLNKITRRPYMDKATGRVAYRNESRISEDDAPFTVSVKIDGEEHRITMNRENEKAVLLATAMRNLTAVQYQAIVKYLGAITRGFSAINTRYNPAFFLKNIVRDMQEGLVISRKFDEPGFGRALLRDWYKAMAYGSSKGDGEWARWRREFELAGGKIYFNQMSDVGALQRRIDIHMRSKSGPKRALDSVFDIIEKVNNRGENALRLAVFKNAVERGYTPARSASMSRNITVNFTRRGELGPVFNAGWAFFNASIQGATNLTTSAIKSKRVRRALLGIVVAGALNDMLNGLFGDDDDDGQKYWDKLPEFQKKTNIIVMIPGTGGRFVQMPVGLGIAAFYNMGREISGALRGVKSPLEAAGSAALDLLDTFNPLGSGGSLLNLLMPTALDPVVDIETNKDFTGKAIQPEQSPYDPPTPGFRNFYASVNPVARWVADAMNKATGGDDVQPGAVSVSPNVLQYLYGYVTGGAGRFAGDVVKLGTAPFDPATDVTIRDVPFASTFTGSKPEWVDKSLFYARVGKIEEALAYAKDYEESGKDSDSFDDKQAAVIAMESPMKSAQKAMRQIRKDRQKLEADRDEGDITRADYAEAKKDLREREQAIVMSFNAAWNEAMKK